MKAGATRTAPPGPPPALGVLALELARWDASAGGDVLAVHIWTDVRPLRGAAGLLDWRLCGRLSAMIQSGRLVGRDDEQLLLPLGGRLPWKVAMVLGLGPRAAFTTGGFRRAVRRTLAACQGLGARALALALPGRDVAALSSRRAAELLLSEIRGPATAGWLASLTVVEPREGHKDVLALAGR